MPVLPKNITEVQWKTSRSRVLKYRVRIKRKEFQADKLFDSLEEAKEFVAESQSEAGRKNIRRKTEYELRLQDFLESPPLSYYAKIHLEENFPDNPHNYLYHKKVISVRSFFKTILHTECETTNHMFDASAGFTSLMYQAKSNARYRELGQFKLEEVDYRTINSYIKQRQRAGKQNSTIRKELSILFDLFRSLRHLDHVAGAKIKLAELLEYDKKLLRKRNRKHFQRIGPLTQYKLFKAMCWCSNIEVSEVFLLSYLTSMRRSEVLTLSWEQIKDNHIHLTHTKSGDDRNVILTLDAKHLLNIIANGKPRTGQVFTISFTSFEKWWQRLQKKFRFRHVNFHSIRKESISRFIDETQTSSALQLAKMLGIANVAKFEEEFLVTGADLTTEDGVLRSAGHKKKQTTLDHYYAIKLK